MGFYKSKQLPIPWWKQWSQTWLGCLQPIIGSDALEVGSLFATNFSSVASEIPRDGKTLEAFQDGIFRGSLPIDR